MENGDPVDGVRVFHFIWTGLLTLVGGLLSWNWKNLNDSVKEKADKEETDRRFREILDQWKNDRESQERMHAENRGRLDAIYGLLSNLKKGGN